MPPSRNIHQRARERTASEIRSEVERGKKKLKMRKSKEGKREGSKEVRRVRMLNCASGVDTRIRKQFGFPAVWYNLQKICPELHLTLFLRLHTSLFLSFTGLKRLHVNTQQHTVYLTVRAQILLVVSTWPLDGLSQWTSMVLAMAEAGHQTRPYHTRSPGLCHSFLHRSIDR